MQTEAEQEELRLFQANLKRKLRYLGSFFSIGLIILGLYLLLNGMMALVTKPSGEILSGDAKESAIFDLSPTPVDSIALSELPGGIINGISTEKIKADIVSAEIKSNQNIQRIKTSGHWQATNYEQGDIARGTYEVKQGDTLWEISEAVYGNGSQWHKILDNNREQIGFLKDGSQALITPGQKLIII